MTKWTWQWLALIGLAGMIFLGVELVRAELISPAPLVDEDAIEVYHEPLYYEHYLVKHVEEGRLRMGEGIGHPSTSSGQVEHRERQLATGRDQRSVQGW